MKIYVEAVFQVISLQGYSFIRQLYPPLDVDHVPTIRMPDMASLHFVITFRLEHTDPNFKGLLFHEQIRIEGESLPYRHYSEALEGCTCTEPGEALAFATMPSVFPPSDQPRNLNDPKKFLEIRLFDISDGNMSSSLFGLEVSFKQVKLRARIFDEPVGEYGVLMDLNNTPFTWLPMQNTSHHDDEETPEDVNMDTVQVDPVPLDKVPTTNQIDDIIQRPKSAEAAIIFEDIEPVSTNEEFSEVVELSGSAFEEEIIEEDIAWSSTPEHTATPEPETDRQQVASLMQQVGSLLIGSRVGQMVVTAGASAVSVSEFDPTRIRTRYTCSPICMLGVEYRMLGPRSKKTMFVESPILSRSSSIHRESLNVEKVRFFQSSYSDILSRLTNTKQQSILRRVVALTRPPQEIADIISSWFTQRLALTSLDGSNSKWALNQGDKSWKSVCVRKGGIELQCECKYDSIVHTELGELILLDFSCSLISSPNTDAERELAHLLTIFTDLALSIDSPIFILQEALNVQQPFDPSFQIIPMAFTAQVIPLGKQKLRGWRRMGGQVFMWSSKAMLHCWIIQSIRITSTNSLFLDSPIASGDQSMSKEYILSKCRLLRSGDASCRLALVDSNGEKTIIRTFNRDDFMLLIRILDTQCIQDYNEEGDDLEPIDSIKDTEWMEQNSGIIGEFLYDFQSRFWFTYRRAFERIGGSTTLLSTDAGWGCMLRTGQSMMSEAMARVLLGREWRLHELRENPDALNNYVTIISCFMDTTKAPLSVHQMAVSGAEYGLAIGEWFGPTVLARVLKVSVRQDGIFPLGKLQAALTATGRPLLILFPLRLGIDKVNPIYYDMIKGALKSHLSVGVVGGRPNRSLYFVGFQDDDLFYLDPHCVRPALSSVRDALATLELHGDTVRACPITELDPSMLMGFVCADADELIELKSQLEGLHAGCPLFSFP